MNDGDQKNPKILGRCSVLIFRFDKIQQDDEPLCISNCALSFFYEVSLEKTKIKLTFVAFQNVFE